MSYIYEPKKHKIKVGLMICHNGITYKITNQLNKNTFLLVDIDTYNNMLHLGYKFRMIPKVKKDIRELKGCEVW